MENLNNHYQDHGDDYVHHGNNDRDAQLGDNGIACTDEDALEKKNVWIHCIQSLILLFVDFGVDLC